MSTERDKTERSKSGNPIKHIPKDAQVVMSILKELGVNEYEPRVINQLLEFTYRYVTCILDDAKIYANHAKKKVIDLDDVKLATDIVLDKMFTTPPKRDVLLELARGRNTQPLPPVKPLCGLRLPPDRHCLIAQNYKLKAVIAQPKKLTKSALSDRSIIKTQLKSTEKLPAAIKRNISVPVVPKSQSVSIPKPVFKFTSNTKPMQKQQKDIKIESDDDNTSLKRKREDDEYENV